MNTVDFTCELEELDLIIHCEATIEPGEAPVINHTAPENATPGCGPTATITSAYHLLGDRKVDILDSLDSLYIKKMERGLVYGDRGEVLYASSGEKPAWAPPFILPRDFACKPKLYETSVGGRPYVYRLVSLLSIIEQLALQEYEDQGGK